MFLCEGGFDGFCDDGSYIGHSQDLPLVIAFWTRKDHPVLRLFKKIFNV